MILYLNIFQTFRPQFSCLTLYIFYWLTVFSKVSVMDFFLFTL